MNGIAAAGAFPPPAAALWHEYRTPDGRVYYSNAVTKATQWTKPEDMMSPAEVRAPNLVCSADVDKAAARSGKSAVEGIHSRGRSQVLVQYRDQAELVGDARRLQEGPGR